MYEYDEIDSGRPDMALADELKRLIEEAEDAEPVLADARVSTFDEVGMLSYDAGLVLTVGDVEWQLTIKRRR